VDLVLLCGTVSVFVVSLCLGIRARRRDERSSHYFLLAAAMVFTGLARTGSISG